MEMRGMMGGFYRISEWIMRLSVTNLLWVVTSLPFWLFIWSTFITIGQFTEEAEITAFFRVNWLFLIIITVVLMTFVLFPATSAMFTSVRKWVMGDTDVPLFKTFFRGYKENYKASMIGGLFYSILFVVIAVDIYWYFTGATGLELVSYIFLGIAALLVTSLFNFFSMVVHYHMKTRQIIKNALLITIGRPFRSLSSAAGAIVVVWLSLRFTFLIPFFAAVIIAFLAFFNFYQIYLKLKEQLEKQQQEHEEEQEVAEQETKS